MAKAAAKSNGSRKPDFAVFVSRDTAKEGDEPKNFYTRVGSAWKVASDGISIKLDALPHDGALVMFPPKED